MSEVFPLSALLEPGFLDERVPLAGLYCSTVLIFVLSSIIAGATWTSDTLLAIIKLSHRRVSRVWITLSSCDPSTLSTSALGFRRVNINISE